MAKKSSKLLEKVSVFILIVLLICLVSVNYSLVAVGGDGEILMNDETEISVVNTGEYMKIEVINQRHNTVSFVETPTGNSFSVGETSGEISRFSSGSGTYTFYTLSNNGNKKIIKNINLDMNSESSVVGSEY